MSVDTHRNLKIAFFTEGLGMGGVEKSLLELVRHLYSVGYLTDIYYFRHDKVDLISSFSKYAEIYYIEGADQPYHRMLYPSKKQRGKLLRIRNLYHGLLFKLSKAPNKWRHFIELCDAVINPYDVVVSYHAPYGLSMYFTLYGVKSQRRMIWIHSTIYDYRIAEKVYQNFDRIICVSKYMAQQLIQECPSLSEKVITAYNYVDRSTILRRAKEPIEEICLTTGFDYLICSVGRLDKNKQFEIAIRACRRLVDMGYNIKWLLCGEGIEHQDLQILVKENKLDEHFILLGLQKNPYKFILASDVFCITSRNEGLPVVAQEALLLNKPVVTTNYPSAKEIIRDGENGYIVEQNDVDVAKAIKSILDNRPKWNSRKKFECEIEKGQEKEYIKEMMNILFY